MNGGMMTGSFDFAGDTDELYFVALGGAGHFGANLNLYGHGGRYLMVDLGMGFGDDSTPGIDILVPDPVFIEERRDRLEGLVVTHAHEDHIGAIAHLWPRIGCPIYASAFTLSVLRPKLREAGLGNRVPLVEVPRPGRLAIGPFDVEFVPVTHSVPEASLLAIRTRAGTIVHTGDWKLDPDPVIGDVTDEAALGRIGGEGVLAVIGDSTGALTPGRSGSEGALQDSLVDLFARYDGRRIAVACFASNVARVESIAKAALAHDRQVALIGRSLHRIEQAARQVGYLSDVPDFVEPEDVDLIPRENLVLICTGSQAEPRSALTRIAADDHPDVSLEEGDVVIFSARAIPGNETEIIRLQNQLSHRGIEVVTDSDAFVHVSGHPSRDELTELYQMLRPQALIPVHGELHHMTEHARLAQECQIPTTLVPENGTVIRLAPGPLQVVAEVEHGYLGIDGKRLLPLDGAVMRSRQRIIQAGAAVVTVVLDRAGNLVADPVVTALGLIDEVEEPDALFDAAEAVRQAVEGLAGRAARDDESVRQAARAAVRRRFNAMIGKKPMTDVHVVRV